MEKGLAVALAPDGRLLAQVCKDGVHVWDWRRGQEVALLHGGDIEGACFVPADAHAGVPCRLLTSGSRGLESWPLRPGPRGEGTLDVGPPQRLRGNFPAGRVCLGPDGRNLAVLNLATRQPLVYDLERQQGTECGRHPNGREIALSPDGRWVATATWFGQQAPSKVCVWHAGGGLARAFSVQEVAEDAGIAFTADSRWLVTGTTQEYRFWRAGSWEPGPVLARDHAILHGPVAATPDGRLLAIARSNTQVQLVEPATAQVLATLPGPDDQRVSGLTFSADGSLLAVSCDTPVAQVWDLVRVRRRLAKMGLDWDQAAPPLPCPEAAGSLDVRVRLTPEESRLGSAFPPPGAAPRQATPAQIAAWVWLLGSTNDRARADAVRALREVGPAALPELLRLADSPAAAAGARGRAREVAGQIALDDVLTPHRVSLRLKDARLPDAVRELARQSGVKLELVEEELPGQTEKRVSLDLPDVPFWEVLDRLCQDAGLIASPEGGRSLRLARGKPVPPALVAYAGPVQLRALGLSERRYVALPGEPALEQDRLVLRVRLLTEPGARLLRVGSPRVLEVVDGHGQSWPRQLPGAMLTPLPPLTPRDLHLDMAAFGQREGALRRLKGTLPVEVLLRRQGLVTIPRPDLSVGKTYRAEDGSLSLTPLAVLPSNMTLILIFHVTTGPSWAFDWSRDVFELRDPWGRHFVATSTSVYPAVGVKRPVEPEELAWLGAVPGAGFPGALPWTALATGAVPLRRHWVATGQFHMPRPQPLVHVPPATVTFSRFDGVAAELPFEFYNLPLP
jgi:hypothetical protein